MGLNPLAEELNEKIMQANPNVMGMLSDKGKAIFFPYKGILGQSAEAKGKKINATIGIALEDDGSPMRLNSIASNISLNPKDVFTYASSYGKHELREKWKEMIYEKNPSLKDKEISLSVVTNALTHGLSMAGYMFVNEGDKVIIPDMMWGNYKLVFANAYGAEIELFNTFKDNGFDIESLKEKLNGENEKKILVLNFPNNPTGYTPTDEEAKQITEIIKESAEKGNKIIVICDDAYFGLVFEEGVFKESMFSYLADIHENVLAVKADGATKEDYVWGFRTGFITYGIKCSGDKNELYEALEAKTAGAVRGSISNAPHISQSLVLNAFNSKNYAAEKQEKHEILKGRFDKVKEILEAKEGYKEFFEALPFNSGYFMCIKLKKHDGEEIRKTLLQKYDTGLIALGDILRVAFSAVSEDKIPELFDNIYNACKG
ncbi:aspartate aminotransferase [Candidatus Woesearchaeota archaeon]|nr:aspartate aminotransferase [Candidatus Woesearchaeota archaeon]|tara:strand:+ start:1536 stop:2828 length:1293 start_codon:yes stop_codon:yes gene_type:complete